jgi:hypothetical protein
VFFIQQLNFNIQGVLYFPFIASILLLLHYRTKAYWIDSILTEFAIKYKTPTKKFFFYLISFTISISWAFLIAIIVFPSSDVDEAMTGAIKAFLMGINPFVEKVVPHILLLPSGNELVYGTYNYGPIDLLVYTIGYLLFSPFFGDVWWLFFTNLVIVFTMYLFIRKIIPISDSVMLLPFMFLFSWFLQDNVVLMCFFLTMAWYIYYNVNSKYKHTIVVIILTLGVLTKLFIAFVLGAYFIYIFKRDLKLWIINTIVGLITTAIVIIPFSIFDVLKSMLFFHVDLDTRGEYATIQGGLPTYLSLFGLNWLFIPLAVILVMLFLFISEKYAKDEIELKLTIFTILNLILLPNSGYSFFMIPSVFILVQYYKNHYSLHNKNLEKTLD